MLYNILAILISVLAPLIILKEPIKRIIKKENIKEVIKDNRL